MFGKTGDVSHFSEAISSSEPLGGEGKVLLHIIHETATVTVSIIA